MNKLTAFLASAAIVWSGAASAEILAMVNYESKTPDQVKALKLSGEQERREGIAILDVDPDGPAADRGLRRGDEILEVAGIEVTEPDDVVNAIKRADRKGRNSVLMLVRTRDGQRFVAVPLKGA